ncbi:MAG: 5-(carboxyamino)imidazole ribonucleotide mutase [Planctomycetota bacterium]|nr:MAG: 5-(carboxyamino)imidazole ribonucleotide mutase [Planctomycetota bacterium]
MAKPIAGIVMGSDSDLEVMKKAADKLKEFGVPFEVRVISAHRTPDVAAKYASTAKGRGLKVIIAGAGAAAHLAGNLAAHTTLPIIGVPLSATDLKGLDALYATVQMPGGIPVATMAIGKAGATNAAILAVQMLALSDEGLAMRLEASRKDMKKKVAARDEKVRKQFD